MPSTKAVAKLTKSGIAYEGGRRCVGDDHRQPRWRAFGECRGAAVRIPGALNAPSCAGAKSRWAPPKRDPSLRAERVGFEPTGGVTRHLLSREARSAGLWHLSICRVATYRANPCDFEWRRFVWRDCQSSGRRCAVASTSAAAAATTIGRCSGPSVLG